MGTVCIGRLAHMLRLVDYFILDFQVLNKVLLKINLCTNALILKVTYKPRNGLITVE